MELVAWNAKGKPRSEIVGMLMERFGEQNPDVGVQ